MSLISAVAGSIARLGGEVAITDDSRRSARAIVEPLRYRNRIYIGGEMHHLGQVSREKYLYVGKTTHRLIPNESVIKAQGKQYIVKRCETYFVKDAPIYEWAILVPCGDRLEDSYDAEGDGPDPDVPGNALPQFLPWSE